MASDVSVKMETIPLSLLVTLSSIALLGVIYAIAFIVFIIVNRNKKIIKMTSPKMNVLILCGAVFGYCTIVLLGLEISLTISTILHQACAFVIPISFTMIYGSVLVKVCRVHMIFTNLRVNGKTTRDEHLMLVVVIMITVDLLVLLLWFFLDPIQCRAQHWKQTDSTANNLTFTASDDVTYYTELCSSSLQPVWICSLYAYKLLVLTALLYFTWRVRHVTIPSLKDSKRVLGVVYTVAMLGVIVLPVLLATTWGSAGPTVRYAVGGLCIWIALTVTITLLFLPNAVLLWRQEKLIKSGNASATDAAMAGQRQFSESMTRIKRDSACCWSTSSLAACCFTEPSKQSEGDRYAQELLATELETMKLTIKEKDTTIRDLTDRLYFGAEHFQRYLTSQQLLHDEKVLETSLRDSRVATPYTIPTPSRNEIRNLRLSCFFSDPEPVASGMKHIRFRDDAAEAVRYSNEAAAAVGALVPPRRNEARYDYGYDRDSVGRGREVLSECSCDGNSCSCSSCCSTWDRESRDDRNVENQDSSNNNRDNYHGGRLLNSVIGSGNRTMEVNNNNNDTERLEELSALNLSVVGSFEESDRSQTRLVAEVHPRKPVKYQDKMSREERNGCNRTPSVVYIRRYSEHQLLQQHPSMQTKPHQNPNIQWNYNREEYRNVHSDQNQIGQPRQSLHRSLEQNQYVQQHPNKLTEQGQNYTIQHSPHRYVQQHTLQREFIQEQLAQQSLERVNRNTNLEHHAQRNSSKAQVNQNLYVKQNANQNTKKWENQLIQHTVNHRVDQTIHRNINQPVEQFVHNPQERPFQDQCQARMDRQFSPKRLGEESSKYSINNVMKQDMNGNSHLKFPLKISIENSDVQKPDANKDIILMKSSLLGDDSCVTNKHINRNVEAMNLQGSQRYTTFKPWRSNGINNRRVRCVSARETVQERTIERDSNSENKIQWKNTERWRNSDCLPGTRTYPSTDGLEGNGGVIDLQAIENDSFSVVNGSLPVGLTPATLGNSALSNESLKPRRSRMTSSHLPTSSGERTVPPTRRNQSASPRFYEMTVAKI